MAKPETHAAIKAKFPKLNLTKKRLDLIGDKLEPKVTTELTLDALIDSFNEFQPIEDLAKLDDKVVTAEQKLKEAKNPPKKDEEKVPEEVTTPADMPDWAKPLFEQNKKLSESLASMQKEKSQGTIRQTATEKLKDIPVSYWGKRAIPEKEEDLEAFVTEVTTDYGAFTKELTDQGIKVMPKPVSGGGAPPDSKTVSADVKNFMANSKPAQPAAGAPVVTSGNGKFINTPSPL